jgi:hypothetical protein
MALIVAFTLVTVPVLYFAHRFWQFLINVQKAKSSGIPYVVSPIYFFNRFWLATSKIWLPIFRLLPPKLVDPWIDVLDRDWTWHNPYGVFERLKTDTFLVASPGGLIMSTADANVIHEITTRRIDFPKPTELYKVLDVYGKSLISNEGAEWRRHRKITSSPFSEKINRLVWAETLCQAQYMLTSWVGKNGEGNTTIPKVSDDTMRLSLHVISRAGFNVKCLWSAVNGTDDSINRDAINTNIIPKGHKLSYVDSMSILMRRVPFIILFPDIILSKSHYISQVPGVEALLALLCHPIIACRRKSPLPLLTCKANDSQKIRPALLNMSSSQSPP